MWTLAELRTRLSDRLGEESVVFWDQTARDSYINDAQRFVASVTRGVPETVTGAVSTASTYLTLPDEILNAHAADGYVEGGDALTTVGIETANLRSPNWRTFTGKKPEWLVLDLQGKRAYVTPIPRVTTTVYLTVSVFPDELTLTTDELFNGAAVMEKYQNATLQLAAMYALLKERYEGDAERYYQFAIQELQTMGINPNVIPPFQEVQRAQSDG
jgi:hypothetical protein